MNYNSFLNKKTQQGGDSGFEPLWMPDFLFDFQKYLVDWSLRKGRAGLFSNTGLGKTICQLVWAENVALKTNGNILVLTPLAVANQTVKEGEKFGIKAVKSQEGEVFRITVANYERLHYFKPEDFAGCVCDESGILKSFRGATRQRITRFMSKMEYRLLCTATPSPNDYIELGTSSEALGELSNSDMLSRFFRQLDDKSQKKEARLQRNAEDIVKFANNPKYYQKLSYRVSQTIGQWRLKHHAKQHFWRWISSWSRACRMPSDLGFNDDDFILPELIERDHIIEPKTPPPGFLLTLPAIGLHEERIERKRTLNERCEYVRDLVDHEDPALIFCHLNPEGDLLEKLIPNSIQVAGRHSDEYKLDAIEWFLGDLCICNNPLFKNNLNRWGKSNDSSKCICGHKTGNRKLITKSKMFGFGLNFQHCGHVVTFVTHSYEQYYQSVRRCFRYGRKDPVRLDVVATVGEVRVLENMRSKKNKADIMFKYLVEEMNNSMEIKRENLHTQKMEVPAWLL